MGGGHPLRDITPQGLSLHTRLLTISLSSPPSLPRQARTAGRAFNVCSAHALAWPSRVSLGTPKGFNGILYQCINTDADSDLDTCSFAHRHIHPGATDGYTHAEARCHAHPSACGHRTEQGGTRRQLPGLDQRRWPINRDGRGEIGRRQNGSVDEKVGLLIYMLEEFRMSGAYNVLDGKLKFQLEKVVPDAPWVWAITPTRMRL